jgi:hypothetical protein
MQCLLELGAIVILAGLDLDELGNQLPLPAVQEVIDCGALAKHGRA